MFSWLRSFPILRRQPRSLSSVSGLLARWSCVRGWFMRSFWACNHGSAAIAPLSPLGDERGSLCHYPRWLLCQRAENHRLVLWAIWGLQWELSAGSVPTDLSLLPQQLFCAAPRWFCCAVSRRAQRFIWRADRGSDVDRGIGGWAIVLWGWRFGEAAPLGCRGRRRTRPRVDGRAFPGRREIGAGGVHTS